jgi:proteasome lid subunit RPN8/RPN11
VIRWVSERAEDRARDFTALARRVGAASAVRLLAHATAAPLVLVAAPVGDEIAAHLCSSADEMGGLLLGHAYVMPITPRHGFGFLIEVNAQVTSEQFDNSPVSLRMESQLWQRATPHLDAGLSVVGWYHSHPGLGAFFSGTDRATQRAFFREPYSLGLVIDPVRAEHACYAGPDSAERGLDVRVAPSLAPLDALFSARRGGIASPAD